MIIAVDTVTVIEGSTVSIAESRLEESANTPLMEEERALPMATIVSSALRERVTSALTLTPVVLRAEERERVMETDGTIAESYTRSTLSVAVWDERMRRTLVAAEAAARARRVAKVTAQLVPTKPSQMALWEAACRLTRSASMVISSEPVSSVTDLDSISVTVALASSSLPIKLLAPLSTAAPNAAGSTVCSESADGVTVNSIAYDCGGAFGGAPGGGGK